jgi:hypothetical protein
VRAHYPVADFHEDPTRILSLSERPLVLNEGHRCAHASRRVWLEAEKLDEAKTEVAARTDTMALGDAPHVAVKRDRDSFVDIGDCAQDCFQKMTEHYLRFLSNSSAISRWCRKDGNVFPAQSFRFGSSPPFA